MPKTKDEIPDEEIFVEKKPPDSWMAKPLSLEGTARLIQLVGGMLGDAAQRAAVQGIIKKGQKKGQPQAGWTTILGVLGTEQLAEFLSIVTGKSPKWVTKHYSLVGASKAVGEFLQQEDLGAVLKNLRPTAESWAEAVENAGSQEPSTGS